MTGSKDHASRRDRSTDTDGPTRYLTWGAEGEDGDELALVIQPEVADYTDPYAGGGSARFETATWSSPVVSDFGDFSELVASWSAATPAGTWIEISATVWPAGTETSEPGEQFVLGRWASDTSTIHRTSVPHQRTPVVSVDCDVLAAAAGQRLGGWQLRVTAHRQVGRTSWPGLTHVGALTSPPRQRVGPVSSPGPAAAARTTLDVPSFSQMTHRGRHPEYGGGGEAWCSAASTAMVLAYWGSGPAEFRHSSVGFRDTKAGVRGALADNRAGPGHAHPAVVSAAAGTYDYAYGGTGNWSFNAAYAATFGMVASISRLHSLAEAETFVEAGIPLVASLSFGRDELSGAGYATAGHLLVIVGFSANGDVVVNDPASHLVASNDEVRTVYDRSQFERLWLQSSGGLVYVIRPPDVPPPAVPAGGPPRW